MALLMTEITYCCKDRAILLPHIRQNKISIELLLLMSFSHLLEHNHNKAADIVGVTSFRNLFTGCCPTSAYIYQLPCLDKKGSINPWFMTSLQAEMYYGLFVTKYCWIFCLTVFFAPCSVQKH